MGMCFWEGMKKSIKDWVDSCRICDSRHKHGRLSNVLRSISAIRPHAVLVYDLFFLTPKGENGEVGALCAVCVVTKLVWVRSIFGKTPRHCAYALLAVVMDSAVCPLKLLSDRESSFREKVVLEFCALFLAKQGWSMAWSPESHGVVEVENKEVISSLGQTLETLAGSKGAEWPYHLCVAENRRRTRYLTSGISPLALSRGYFGVTPLQTAMGALESIPRGLPLTTWMRSLVGTHRLLMKEHLEDKADRETVEEITRNIHSRVRPRQFHEGDLVMVT